MAVPFERLCVEDLNLGVGQISVTMPAGGSAIGHLINAETFGPSGLVWYLGGSILAGLQEAAQVDVVNPVTFRLPAMDLSAFLLEVTVTCRVDNSGGTVQPAIRNISDGVTIGLGTATNATTDAVQTFTIPGALLPTDGPLCKLQVLPGSPTIGVYCNGTARLRINAGQTVAFSPIPPPPPAATGAQVFGLGGSLVVGLLGSARTDVVDAISILLPAGDLSAYTLEVIVTTRSDSAGTTAQPVLRDVTHGADLGSGAASAATSNTVQRFTIPGNTLPSTSPTCRLQLQPSNNGALIYGNGYARLYVP